MKRSFRKNRKIGGDQHATLYPVLILVFLISDMQCFNTTTSDYEAVVLIVQASNFRLNSRFYSHSSFYNLYLEVLIYHYQRFKC